MTISGIISKLRNDEAVVDRGGARSQLGTNFEKEDLEVKRREQEWEVENCGPQDSYNRVHVPLGSTRHRSHRRHRHHGNKHKKRSIDRALTLEEGSESPVYDTPSQRVQFLLGTEDDDEEHIPHDLFTEMDESVWLKFEEDVEDGGERWSKPYVATLSLHSLFELRSCIINSTVLLDMRANTIEEISDMVLDHQELYSPLGDELRKKVRETLLKQHHHQSQKKLANRLPIVRSFADMSRRASELHLDKNGEKTEQLSDNVLTVSLSVSRRERRHQQRNSSVDFSKIDLHFMKKIPIGAEACNVLVGELEFLNKPVVAFVRLSPAVLLRPVGRAPQYHEIGRSIATLMTDEVFHDVAYKAKDRNDLIAGIDEFLDQVTVLPPGEWDPSIRIEPPKNVPSQEKRKRSNILPNGLVEGDEEEEDGGHAGPELQRTGRWFGGLFLDIKRKAPHYLSDYTDAISLQCVASSSSSTVPACPLSSPLEDYWARQQKDALEYGLSYLSLRACIGLWTAFLCIVLVATDASSLVRYITRFTEEAFASLICIIFIYEALEKLIHLGDHYPFNKNNNLDKLTMYSCSCVEPSDPSNGTLKYWEINNVTASEIYWEALEVKVRAIISDFAVFFTILTMVLVDYGLGIPSPKLQVPTNPDDRGWLINPLGPNPWWTAVITVLPALLCTILIFMDQQITAVIINRKEHKLKKGCGYHLDLFMVGVMLGVCSVMGLPWFVAATVLSITHVNSLKLESECSAPGEQPKFLGIREQRFTGLMIFTLMGCSVFMTSVLKFFDRLTLFAMPAKHQPDFVYLRHVPRGKVHLFTHHPAQLFGFCSGSSRPPRLPLSFP
ncbi:Sodium-driven chloride bicarbonate exchanger Solute carrier family 4 member 10 [Larimichthys crocea]|uniref:Sodium-driven chloride bicarbonate exchanger Solute carrier family 4 member 10 n=1 Tax=Larimichthys crocea TaxID=215358 RepID=A0A6G0HE00_LARCR|nr:Sodium-driven chloride bicarbonate exchanger Solute carrier family 4 member 10 [Larimichthys crocea]